ncbi:MAG: metal-dependent phosphohydrolase [Deltaproteobacteria bacterium]|nr:MAG: metal-dependent phosphohydrolase [Deltaproteobacteria bacterium]
MDQIIKFIFEARHLKSLKRSGYDFLGNGKESVAEHSFIISVISYILGKLRPEADERKVVLMALFHDLPESRTGDINYFQKKYVTKDEKRAIDDMTRDLFFGSDIKSLIDEFNDCSTIEAKLAADADQLSFLVDLKVLSDKGAGKTERWIETVQNRIKTTEGRELAKKIMKSDSDAWWLDNYVDA